MAKIRIDIRGGEITIDFTDTKDLENQLEKIDILKIDSLLKGKNKEDTHVVKNELSEREIDIVNGLGSVNLLRISERGKDAIKLAVFLASCGMHQEEIKKITGITILSS